MIDPMPTGGSSLERLVVLDVLRGIALLGMCIVHFIGQTWTATGSVADAVHRVDVLFLHNRFFAMFGILFGVGFALQLRRAEARGDHFAPRFLRRLAVLAVFGFIAEVAFGYWVLLGYAIWGFPLLLVRRWSTRALVALFFVSAASSSLFVIARATYKAQTVGVAGWRAEGQAMRAANAAFWDRVTQEAKSPDWRTVIAARLRATAKRYSRAAAFLPNPNFTLFLLGLIGLRLGLFDRPEAHRRLIVALMAAGAASWAVATWVLPLLGTPRPPELGESLVRRVVTNQALNAFEIVRDTWLVLAYMGGVLLMVAHNPAWLRRLAPFAWAGRMALTNYVLQIAILDFTFSNYAFGLKVGPLTAPVAALALFASQMVFSRWWLWRYRLGPLEWLWRSVTDWKVQPLRLAAPDGERNSRNT